LETKLKIKSVEDTNFLAKILADNLFEGIIIGLTGDLGSGKTTFTKYLAKHMGITDIISSPTFMLLKIYESKLPLYHIDAYRLEDIGYDYEFDEYIYGRGVTVIEWYQYIDMMLPKEILKISLKVTGIEEREVRIEGEGRYEAIIEAIDNRYSN